MGLKTIIQTLNLRNPLYYLTRLQHVFFLYSMDSMFYVLFVFMIDFQKVLAGAL